MSLDFSIIWEENLPEIGPCWTFVANTPSFNVSNANGADLLRFLGFEDAAGEPCGDLEPSEVEARCLRASWSQGPDAALEGEESGGPGTGQCRMVYFGREEGYLQERATQLLALARLARLIPGARVGWS